MGRLDKRKRLNPAAAVPVRLTPVLLQLWEALPHANKAKVLTQLALYGAQTLIGKDLIKNNCKLRVNTESGYLRLVNQEEIPPSAE